MPAVAVIAIDEETYQTPPFKGSPIPIWTTEVGRVLNAVIDGGAKVVGFDIVFSNSIELSELPFGDNLLGRGCAASIRPSFGLLRRVPPPVRWCWAKLCAATGLAGTTDRGRSAEEHPGARCHTHPDGVVRRVPLTFPGVENQCPRWRSNWRRARSTPSRRWPRMEA